ncbi:hypothetical protein NDU88_001668 [Pleurodeles waltl]|uniref:Uncharacterized protein n=1 Tax=Pleurodeles waltl TaxID=8319 RepID=A0AAV7UTZ9_PLEWA|nr:hypothetical protein NDU88_001668 [Pleurodeles waltl]
MLESKNGLKSVNTLVSTSNRQLTAMKLENSILTSYDAVMSSESVNVHASTLKHDVECDAGGVCLDVEWRLVAADGEKDLPLDADGPWIIVDIVAVPVRCYFDVDGS